MTRRLIPDVPEAALYPPDGAWMARTDLQTTRLLGYSRLNLDAVTGHFMGLFGRQPCLRHAATATPEILSFLTDAGLVIKEDMRLYRTEEEAVAAANTLLREGYRFIAPYPQPAGLYPEDAPVVPTALWYRLNAKARMSDLVAADHLAPRQTIADPAGLRAPVYLKAGGDVVTGWGYTVRYCETSQQINDALDWFATLGAADDLIAEEAMDVVTCWCAHIGCSDDTTYYLGAAEQTFAAPGQQDGSVIDPDRALPLAGQKLVLAAGEAARAMGYRGIAALDVGVTTNGRLIAFDPNFRVNASTSQVLLHHAAVQARALRVSQLVAGACDLPLAEVLARLEGPVRDGWFVPTRLLDGALLPAAEGTSLWTGFVLGLDREEAAARNHTLSEMMRAEG
ncbi:MAG: hypothetical protein AAFX45_12905 [Pseudomonadota bacterium]